MFVYSSPTLNVSMSDDSVMLMGQKVRNATLCNSRVVASASVVDLIQEIISEKITKKLNKSKGNL